MNVLQHLHQVIWGPWTLALFLGTGIFFTIKIRFFQICGFPTWWRETVGSIGQKKTGKQKEKGISQLQSVCTALAASVGTGNIAGVAAALTAGGPGALFWMWVCAALGMATAYGETMLGIKYRVRDAKGNFLCGPFLYMERGLSAPWLGTVYGILCLLCSLGMGSMVQANSAAAALSYSWQIPSLWGAGILTVLVLLVILGGIGRIGAVAQKLMIAASGIYLFFSLVILISCAGRLPQIGAEIFRCALMPSAALGGTAGYGISRSIRYGMARGVFSNEAGLGTLAVLHGAAEDVSPRQQGMWAMFEVFFDTIVLCTLTGLVILAAADSQSLGSGLDGAALAAWSYGMKLGAAGEYLISAGMAVFAFATIIAWFYLGRQSACYLARTLGIPRSQAEFFTGTFYPILYLGAVFAGGLGGSKLVWMVCDLWNGLMAFPNLTALWLLSGEVEFPSADT